MYEETFNFSQRPFNVCPQPEDFFPGQSHQQAITASQVCVERRNGPATIIGAVGTGKSLTLQVIGEAFSEKLDVVSIECSRLEQRSELLQSILFGMNLPFRELGEGELRLSLIDHLKNGNGNSDGVLLLVDEADCLSIELLDELRLITNVTRDGLSQVQLVLSGTQRLEESLNDPRLASFSQRIASRSYLQNFSRDEVAEYIDQQIESAGRKSVDVFEGEAIGEVARSSDGCPRLINQLCERSLAVAASQNQAKVTQDIVKAAWAELQNLPIPSCSTYSADSNTDCSNEGQSESVVEFGSLDDEVSQPYTSSYGDQADNAVVQQETAEAETVSSQADQYDVPDESFVDSPVVEFDQAADHSQRDTDGGGESDTAEQWDGQLPTNLGVTDYRAYGSGLAGFAATTYGSGGDPFAPEEEQPPTQQFQYGSGNAFETQTDSEPSFQPFQAQDTYDNTEAVSNDLVNDDVDQQIQSLNQEQQDLIEKVDAVTDLADGQGVPEALVEFGSDEITSENDVQAAFDGLEQIDQARSAETVNTSEQLPVASAIDPFDEDFEEEVLLQDTYSPFVAQQNKSSLSVTSEHLSHLQPNDELGVAGDSNNSQSVAGNSTGSESPSGFENPPAEPNRTYIPVQSVTTELTFPELSETLEPQGSPEEIDPDLAALTSGFSFDEDTSLHATAEPAPEAGNQMEYGYRDQSVDTGQDIYSVTDSEVSPTTEDSVSQLPANVSGEIGTFGSNDDRQAMTEVAPESLQYSQEDPLDQSQQVLREILTQQQVVNESQFNQPQPSEQDVDSISVEYPITEHDNYQAPSGSVGDDRDMLRVNESHYSQTPQQQPVQPNPYADAEPSTGEAKRLDYGQLFDQLRNMPKQ